MFRDDEGELVVTASTNPVDRLGIVDFVIAFSLGAVIFAFLKLWAFPGIYPDVWSDLAVAMGVRPAEVLCPGIWQKLVSCLFRFLPPEGGFAVLKILGPATIGFCVMLVYLLFREVLSLTSRLRLQYSPQRFLIVRLASALGAVFFGCADPVWRAGQIFAPVTWLVLLSVSGAYLFFSFLQTGRLVRAYAAMLILGVLSAESPMGFVFVLLCWSVFFLAARNVLTFDMPLLNPFIEQISKWHMTFLFVFGFVAAIALNVVSFKDFGGSAAAGLANGDLPISYGVRFWSLVVSAASPLGWLLALGLILLPLGVAAKLLPRAVDEEQFLPFHIGALFIVTALATYVQLASLDPLWMWTWLPNLFRSQYLLCLLMLAAAATVTFSLVVLGVDAFCRNHRRLALQMFAEMQMDEEDQQLLASKRFLGSVRRVGLVVLPVLLVVGVGAGRYLGAARAMTEVLCDYVAETVRECGDAQWLFTDGAFDVAVELAAAEKGGTIRAISLMGGNSPREVFVRSRGIDDEEDLLTLRSGPAATLRTWVKDKPERLAASALQLGFEMWRRDGRNPPPSSGVLCRPKGQSAADRQAGVKAAKALAERILALYANNDVTKSAGAAINRLFLFCQWRLSRLMRQRAESADREGRTEEALAEIKLADELDNHNAAIKEIRESMERMHQMMLRQMTPREGLQLALVRADFSLARKYAESILDADPEDPNANFGMGMSYFVEQQWSRAEVYLRRCIVRNPREPAIYNNLAIIQLKTGRFEAARRSVQKALELLPESAEVKDTAKQIEKAIALAAQKGMDVKKSSNK